MFPIIGFQMVTGNFFQSIGQAGKSIYLSLTRQLIFLVPCLFLLPMLMPHLGLPQLDGVWWSLPASDFLASLNAAILLWMQIQALRAQAAGQATEARASLSNHPFLRLPRRIHYFAINRVAPYIPIFSIFQHDKIKDPLPAPPAGGVPNGDSRES